MTTEATLLAQIYADPTADGPRLVYADYLQERGDPRGELIALQILNRDTPRERELLGQHARQWLGPLADVIDLSPNAQTTFERGFLAIAEIMRDARDRLPPLLHDPAWSTVEEIRGWDSDIVLAKAPLPGLRRLESMLPIDRLAVLAQRPTPLANLAELVVASFAPFTNDERAHLGHCEGLPGLRELVVAANFALTIDDILWLVESPVARRLERLVIRRPGRPRTADADEHRAVAAIANVLVRTTATVPSLAITTPAAPVELVRAPSGLYRVS